MKRAFRTGQLVLDPQSRHDPENQTQTVDEILKLISKYSVVDQVRRVVRLSK